MKNFAFVVILLLFGLNLFSQNQKDEKAIHKVVEDMAKAWTNGDGKAFAEHFADEHDYFVWNGLYTPQLTKDQNAQNHQRIFDQQYKDTKHYAVVDKVRFVTAEVAVVLVLSAVVAKSAEMPKHPQVLWSATLKKEERGWEIVSFHNADIEILDTAASRANSPIPVEVMYKNWYAAYPQD